MNQKIKISIPEPCHKDWQNMSPVDKGRFCESCNKKVLDFTYLSDNEIIKFVNKKENLCVRLNKNQQNRTLIETQNTSNYFGYFTTSVFVFLGLGNVNSHAQEKKVFEQTEFKNSNKVTDSVKKRIISGNVSMDGMPIQGVHIVNKNNTLKTQTDINGIYFINASNNDVIEFSFEGIIKNLTVGLNSNKINVALHDEPMYIGQVVIGDFDKQAPLPIRVYGAVVSDGKPLVGAQIKIVETGKFVFTDSLGNYAIRTFKGNNLEVSYLDQKKVISISNSKELNIQLNYKEEILMEIGTIIYVKNRTFFGRTFHKITNWFKKNHLNLR